MATPPELMQAVSEATGVALPTVVDMDRRLVKAKLRTKGGRGLNAARMTPLDAARLDTQRFWLACSRTQPRRQILRYYEQTRPGQVTGSNSGLFGNIGLDDLAELAPGHGFVEGFGRSHNIRRKRLPCQTGDRHKRREGPSPRSLYVHA